MFSVEVPVQRQDFVEENHLAPFFFLRLPVFEVAVLLKQYQRHFATFAEEFAANHQADIVFEEGVGLVQKVLVNEY